MKNISFMGAVYSDVPAVTLPDAGGGVARFDDASITTATASDVTQGKLFLSADGTITTGTNSGGGGGGDINALIDGTYSGAISCSTVTAIKSYFFQGCSNITAVDFPEVTSIGSYAFADCLSLTTINFPKATTFNSYTFKSCNALTSMHFSSLTTVPRYAFQSLASITTLDLPSVTEIETYAFQGCVALTSADFPLVTGIGSHAFRACNNIAMVSLPSLASISNSVFYSCRALESAYIFANSVPTAGTGFFGASPMVNSSYLGHYGTIFVKASLLDSFKTATGWGAYSARMVGLTDEEIAALG